jgi:hypothetical protein
MTTVLKKSTVIVLAIAAIAAFLMIVQSTPAGAATTPGAPANLRVTATGDRSVSLAWDAPADTGGALLSGYLVQVTPSCGLCTGGLPLTNSTTILGLTNGVNYTVKVFAVNLLGNGVQAATLNNVVAGAPTTVQSPTVLATGDGQVSLSWGSPFSIGAGLVTGYQVDVSPVCLFCTGTVSVGTSTTIAGLTNGSQYTFTIRAKNSLGLSLPSLPLVATPATLASAPLLPVVTGYGSQSVSLAWLGPLSNGGANVTGYSVEVSPPCPSCTGKSPAGLSTTIGGLSNGITYSFVVRAVNAAGNGAGTVAVQATPKTVPSAPTSVVTGTTGDHQVNLSWSPPASDGGSPITGYLVDISPVCLLCAGWGPTGTSTTISGLANGVEYSFTVKAVNSEGVSVVSSPVTTTPSTHPDAPLPPLITSTGNGSVGLTWSAPLSDGGSSVTGYEIVTTLLAEVARV